MQDKPQVFKSVGAYATTYENIQKIAEALAAEKGVPVSLTTALGIIVDFYVKAQLKGRR